MKQNVCVIRKIAAVNEEKLNWTRNPLSSQAAKILIDEEEIVENN
jgi:hypothetical protein